MLITAVWLNDIFLCRATRLRPCTALHRTRSHQLRSEVKSGGTVYSGSAQLPVTASSLQTGSGVRSTSVAGVGAPALALPLVDISPLVDPQATPGEVAAVGQAVCEGAAHRYESHAQRGADSADSTLGWGAQHMTPC